MFLNLNTFLGVMPRINEQQLPVGAAVEASDFKTDSACIEPYKTPGAAVTTMAGCRTLVVWPTSEDRVWPPGNDDAFLCWDKQVDYCNGVAQGYDRIIYTGDEYPKIADPTVLPLAPKKLGAEPPATAPSAADGNSGWVISPRTDGVDGLAYTQIFIATPHTYETGVDADNPLTSVSYCYTYVDDLGQESAPSPPSQVYDVSGFTGGQGIQLTGFSPSDPTNNTVPTKRIYRATAGTSDAEFLYIGDSAGGDTTFDDYDSSTGTFRNAVEAIQTTGWRPPPHDLTGLVGMAGGVLAGYRSDSNEICFSEPLIQYAWPEKYRLTMPQPVLGIASLGEELVVFMASILMAVRGEPGYMTVSEIYGGKGTPCLTGRGVVKMESGLLYPGHDGLYLYNGSSCLNITASSMNTMQWRCLLPDKFLAIYHDGRYWAFREASDKALAIDISNGSVIEMALGNLSPVSGLHVDYHGRFWILSADKAYPWSEGEDSRDAVWKSGLLTFAYPVNLSSAIITSDSPTTENAIQLEVWSHYNGVKTLVFDSLAMGVTVPLNKPFRLPGGFLTTSVQVKLRTKVTVRDMRFATSMSELAGAVA